MTPVDRSSPTAWSYDVVDATPDVRRELAASAQAIPFEYQHEVTADVGSTFRLLRVHGPEGIAGGLMLQTKPASMFPGHCVVHVERLGTTLPEAALAGALEHLRGFIDADGSVLRCTINVFTPQPELRARVESALEASGFQLWDSVDNYLHTLAIDLRPPVEEVFAGLHRSARRNVRQLSKKPAHLRVIDDPSLAPRMHDLVEASYVRTGGVYRPLPLDRLVEEARLLPEQSRFVGLFLDEAPDEAQALVGFAWGRNNGDHADYSVGASAADLPIRLPVGYPLLWDLIEWAAGWGASWFDLGGVSISEGEDPLEGISDFKRFFSTDVRKVGGTWVLPPHSLRARLAQRAHPAVAGVKEWLSQLGAR